MAEVGGKKRIGIIVIAVIVAALLGILAFKKLSAKDVSKSAAAMTPPTIPTADPTPAPPPDVAKPAEAAKPAAAAKPTAAAEKDDGDEPAPKAVHSGSKKHVVAKKAKGKKAHR
jgi:hypothetical protein